jgi:hypothetical protein
MALVKKSKAPMATKIGQNNRALLLRIFLTLLAIDAIPSMRKRIETLEGNFVSTLVTLAEIVGRTIQTA